MCQILIQEQTTGKTVIKWKVRDRTSKNSKHSLVNLADAFFLLLNRSSVTYKVLLLICEIYSRIKI